MRLNRILLSTLLVVVALFTQICVLARLNLPGAVPDLLLLVVLALSLVYGHTAGALIGFCAGLLADFAPPADHAAGRYALVLCVIGYLAGLAKPETGRLRSAAGPMLVVVGASIGSTLLYAGVGSLVGDDGAASPGLAKLLITAALYNLLLAPFTVPLIMALARHTEHDPLIDSSGGSKPDGSYGWLNSAGGLGSGRLGRKSSRVGSPRSSLMNKAAKNRAGKAGRLKGVKRL
ncbi:rod shape-determining protein MreD [Streptomyces palmae]|uniref:Rod shape-determining protein MreD n=1 Tax=Streptomyces palmae TaxID=1701085 RepID=A0A4Z0HHJ5_9ACTN|nr:rod shape-determining protein MreD [Streptomyces palmae]TGB16217.1 rod shape-determining protein MreD [Streptomyces palmae]